MLAWTCKRRADTAFWLDFLDVPFVRHMEATFFEPHPDAFQRPTERDSAFRIPLTAVLANQTGMHSVEIAKDVMPTIGLHAIRLPSGAVTENSMRLRTTSMPLSPAPYVPPSTGRQMNSLHAAILAVPQWHGHVLHGVEDATLLRVTDEPIMAKFGLLRHG